MKPKIIKIVRTCAACPSQWDGWDKDGTYFYFRYRHGVLRVDREEERAISKKEIVQGPDGFMTYDELKDHLKDVMDLPEQEDNPEYVKGVMESHPDWFDSLCRTLEDVRAERESGFDKFFKNQMEIPEVKEAYEEERKKIGSATKEGEVFCPENPEKTLDIIIEEISSSIKRPIFEEDGYLRTASDEEFREYIKKTLIK